MTTSGMKVGILAAGGDLILIPEIPFSEKKIVKYLLKRHAMKKNYSIVVAAEGISPDKNTSAAKYIGNVINKGTGFETRDTILGYLQRGGTPSPFDRILATRFGAKAAEMIAKREFGRMVALEGHIIWRLIIIDINENLAYNSSCQNGTRRRTIG